MLDADLAELYGVETRALLQAVRRNRDRFPSDFCFRLTSRESRNLRSRSVISSSWGGRRHAAYGFTEQGVAMLSSVLRSRRAIRVNVAIMRAFVRLRAMLASQDEWGRKLEGLGKKYDAHFRVVFEALRLLMEPPVEELAGPKIGFRPSGRGLRPARPISRTPSGGSGGGTRGLILARGNARAPGA